jgi:[ribosomal protein S5]-alanine N-acetyltransferase
MRYIGPYQLPDAEAYRRYIATKFFPYYARGEGHGFWAAVEKVGGAFLGWFVLRPALDYRFAAEAGHRAGEVELGYRLRKAAWGKGYATEGSRALVRKAFAELGAECVVATALVGNAASIRVLEKAGLRRVGEFALPGYDQPSVKYALRRDEYAVDLTEDQKKELDRRIADLDRDPNNVLTWEEIRSQVRKS